MENERSPILNNIKEEIPLEFLCILPIFQPEKKLNEPVKVKTETSEEDLRSYKELVNAAEKNPQSSLF